MNTLTTVLRDKNLKVTPQRLAIYKALVDTDIHPTADELYDSLKSTHPTMSLATVYKTLDALCKVDLAHTLDIGDDSTRFDANTKPHLHLVCTKCHRVEDIYSSALEQFKSVILKENNFDIHNQKIYFYGVCSQCKKKCD